MVLLVLFALSLGGHDTQLRMKMQRLRETEKQQRNINNEIEINIESMLDFMIYLKFNIRLQTAT